MGDSMNRKIKVTTSEKKQKKKFRFRYDIIAIFAAAVLIITFIIYMLQTSVTDII